MPGATEVPLALAFGAGLVATVNPCGFAMLPSFVSYYLGASVSGKGGPGRVAEGLWVGLVLTAGFMAVFGSAGMAFSLGAQAVVQIVPWVTIVVGLALMALGGWLLAGKYLVIPVPGLRRPEGAGYRSMLAFGMAYAVGSLSCTLPVFLVVVSAAVSAGSPLGILGVVLAYGLGMSTILMLLCLGTAGFREFLVRTIRPLLPHMSRISGVLLLLGGGYMVYYWASLLEIFGGDPESGPIRLVQSLQRQAQDLVLRPGERLWLAAGVALLLAAALSLVLRQSRAEGGGTEGRVAEESEERSEDGRRTWAGRSGSRTHAGQSSSD